MGIFSPGGAGVAPTGAAGGDLTGTYPSPTIGALKVTNAKVSTTAAIALSKLADPTTGKVVGSVSSAAAAVFPPGFEYDFVTRTTDLTVSATSAAAAVVWLQGSSVTYDGSTRIKLEAFCSGMATGTSGALLVNLWDDTASSDLHRIIQATASSGTVNDAVYGAVFLTPAAGARIYSLRAWRATANGTLIASTANDSTPAWFRITQA